MSSTVKQELYQRCLSFIDHRADSIRQAMSSAQASANDETKSSAGDKYETGRAMLQIEIEKLSAQLQEVMKLRQTLQQISPTRSFTEVQPGSLVTTSAGIFYISISAGQFVVGDANYVTIALGSPIGMLLRGKHAGDQITFNQKIITIQRVG